MVGKGRRSRRAFGRKALSCFAAAVLAASLAMPSLAVAEDADGEKGQDAAASEVETPTPDADAVEFESNQIADIASDEGTVGGAEEGAVDSTASDASEAVESTEEEGGSIDEVLPLASSSTTKAEDTADPKAGEDERFEYSWNLDATSTDMAELADDGTLVVDVDGHLSSNLVLGTSVAWTASADAVHPAGSVEIRVPDYLLLARDGTPYKTSRDENNHMIKDGLTVSLGVPKAPSVSADGWQYTQDKDAGEYVITNAVDIAPGTKFVCEVNYSYSNVNSAYQGITFNGVYQSTFASLMPGSQTATARIMENGREISSRTIDASYEVHADLLGTEAEAAGLYMDWQDAWGGRPEDADDYYYVVWDTAARLNWFYEPYDLSISTTSEMGEIVGRSYVWAEKKSSHSSTPDPAQADTASFELGGPASSDSAFLRKAIFNNSTVSSNYEDNAIHSLLLVRYAKDAVPSGVATDLDVTVSAELAPADHDKQTAASSATTPFTPVDYTAIPGNSFELNASGAISGYLRASYYQHSSYGQLDQLRAGEQTAGLPSNHSMHASAYAETIEEGADPSDSNSYGKEPCTVELIVDMAYLNGASSILGPEDYEITKVLDVNEATVTLYEPVADPSTGSLSGRAVEGAIDPLEVTVLAEIDGVWTPVGSWVQTESGRIDISTFTSLHPDAAFTAYDEAVLMPDIRPSYIDNESQYDDQQRYDLELPDGTTGVKLSFETTAFAASVGEQDSSPSYGFVPVVALNPTDAVMSRLVSSTSSNCYVLNTLSVKRADGTLVGFEGDPKASSSLYKSIEQHDLASFGLSMFHDSYASSVPTAYKYLDCSYYANSSKNDTTSQTISINPVSNDTAIRTQSVQTTSDPVASGMIEPQREATIRILLPRGVEVDPTSIFAFEAISSSERSSYTADNGYRYFLVAKYVGNEKVYAPEAEVTSTEFTPDWRGSGRTMMTVGVRATSADAYDSGGGGQGIMNAYPTYLVSGFSLSFTPVYSWTAMADYGSTLEFLYAYEGDGEDLSAWRMKANDSSSSISGGSTWTAEDKELMVDLSDDRSSDKVWSYRKSTTTLNYPTSAQYGLSLAAKSTAEAEWHNAGTEPDPVEVYAGQQYQYRARTALEEGSTSTGNVMYLPLESYEGSGWRGSLEGVDVSQIRDSGCEPAVHFSTLAGLDMEDEAARDLSDTAIWSTEKPEDASAITAVAIDCTRAADGSAFELPEHGSLVAILTMRAPTEGTADLAASGALAMQQAYLASTVSAAGGSSNDRFLHVEHTAVGLDTMSLTFAKADSEGITADGQGGAEVDGSALVEGAQFALYRSQGAGSSALVDPDDPASGGWELVAEDVSDPHVTFEGLAPGDYRLVEVAAAEGYVTPTGQWDVKVDPLLPNGNSVTAVSDSAGNQPPAFARADGSLVLANVALATLPITGAGGLALGGIIGAAALAGGIGLHLLNRKARVRRRTAE